MIVVFGAKGVNGAATGIAEPPESTSSDRRPGEDGQMDVPPDTDDKAASSAAQ